MKLLATRTLVLIVLALLFLLGFTVFAGRYLQNAAVWAQHPSNQHLYRNGRLKETGTVYDHRGEILLATKDGMLTFHPEQNIRTAVMHATGDPGGNVASGMLNVMWERLTGWNLLSGAYRYRSSLSAANNLTLTLDAGLCALAFRELNGRRGAVGVYNYRTGEIICMTSSPSFDPQNPPDIQADPERYEGVYLNRLLSAVYTPGSIFKVVTAAAALETIPGIEERQYHCSGKLQIGADTVTCLVAHGQVTLKEALAHSCNVTFADIAMELGAETLTHYAELAGFNNRLTVNGIRTAAGRVDVTQAAPVELAWAGIGQYTITANPLAFMVYMGAIANGGLGVAPELVAREDIFPAVTKAQKRILPEETAAKLKAMLRNNTLAVYGESRFSGLELCAKSGTAEVGKGKEPHAWFAGFLDREDYPYAFAVIIENGGTGSRTAAAVAAGVLQAAVTR
ncbi:MAG TPA: penicillin-binding protein [Firmicutes bacterium]|nr:penicillin-binding protein [Bacillota bacterium]